MPRDQKKSSQEKPSSFTTPQEEKGVKNLSGRTASHHHHHYFASFSVCERSATAKTGHTLSSPIFLSVCSFGGVYHQVVHIRYHVCGLIVYEQVPSPLFNFKKRKKMLAFWAHLSKTALCFGISIQRFEVIELKTNFL